MGHPIPPNACQPTIRVVHFGGYTEDECNEYRLAHPGASPIWYPCLPEDEYTGQCQYSFQYSEPCWESYPNNWDYWNYYSYTGSNTCVPI